jgi:hypothetical protein
LPSSSSPLSLGALYRHSCLLLPVSLPFLFIYSFFFLSMFCFIFCCFVWLGFLNFAWFFMSILIFLYLCLFVSFYVFL